jgi:hypothetical protein
VTQLDDPDGLLPADRGRAWLRDRFAGDDGARLIERYRRSRRQRDRRTWQTFDWASRGRERDVPFRELFPHDWTFRVTEPSPLWIHEGYCVRPGCDCQDVTLVLADDDGRVAGRAVVRLHGVDAATVKTCDPAIAGVVHTLASDVEFVFTWHERFREVRTVVRFRKTWSADVADPERAVARLLRDSGPLARTYVYNLGDRVVPALRAVIDDETRPTAERNARGPARDRDRGRRDRRRRRGCPGEPMVERRGRARSSSTDVVDEAAGLGPALAEALTAGVTPESPDAVIAVLSKFPTQDPAVAAAIDARIEREPDRWLPLLPSSPDDVPRYRQLLERAMAAEPISARPGQRRRRQAHRPRGRRRRRHPRSARRNVGKTRTTTSRLPSRR